MAGLDIAAGYRPSVPVNKKRKSPLGMNPGDFDEETGKVTTHAEADQYGREKDIYNAFYGHAGGEYAPGALQKAREDAARGGIIPGSSSSVRPSQPPMAPVDPRVGGTPPESTFNRGNGNWSSDYLAKKFADTDVESSMYRDAALHEPEETAAFRDRRSARDRAAGLNVGRRPGGEVSHPMMPGVPMGAVNENYGGIGDKAKFFTERERVMNEQPNGTERMGRLMSENFYGGSGGVISQADAIDIGQNAGAPERINALRQAGGLAGAAKLGLQDRFVSGSSLTRSPNDTPERTQMLDNIAAIRQQEKERKAAKLGDSNDPNSIAGRLQSRGLAKGEARQQRMNARASGGGGGSQEDMILQMAMNGNPAALQLAGMMAQGNRETAVEDRRGRNAMQLGELNSNTAKYGYDAQKESSLASNKSNETIQGMRDESAQLDRVAELAKNQGNNALLVAVQKSKDELASKLAELQNSTALSIADRQDKNADREFTAEEAHRQFERDQATKDPSDTVRRDALRRIYEDSGGRDTHDVDVETYIDTAMRGSGSTTSPVIPRPIAVDRSKSQLDSVMGEGFYDNIAEVAGNTSRGTLGNMISTFTGTTGQGGYFNPLGPLNNMDDIINKADRAGALSDPTLRSFIGDALRKNIDPEYIEMLKKYRDKGDFWGGGPIDMLTGKPGKAKEQATRILDLMGVK